MITTGMHSALRVVYMDAHPLHLIPVGLVSEALEDRRSNLDLESQTVELDI